MKKYTIKQLVEEIRKERREALKAEYLAKKAELHKQFCKAWREA